MSNILKSLFGLNKTLSKETILETWKKSNKNIKSAEEIIFLLNDDIALLDTLSSIDIKNINQLSTLISLLKKRENKQAYEQLIQHFEFCSKIFSHLNIFDYGYLFLNKFEFLENIIKLTIDEEVMDLILSHYFNEMNYLNGIFYALQKDSKTLLKFYLNLDNRKIDFLRMNGFKLDKSNRL
jgi:prophage maintenance system killer protein